MNTPRRRTGTVIVHNSLKKIKAEPEQGNNMNQLDLVSIIIVKFYEIPIYDFREIVYTRNVYGRILWWQTIFEVSKQDLYTLQRYLCSSHTKDNILANMKIYENLKFATNS